MNYETWKKNLENEFAAHREENTRIVYNYQDEYDYYLNSPDWIMYGDFCNFIRVGTENIGAEITAKYEKIMLIEDEIFIGFVTDEFERIGLWKNKDMKEYAKNIFEFNNMTVRFEDLTDLQKAFFEDCIKEHAYEHAEDIKIMKEVMGLLGDD